MEPQPPARDLLQRLVALVEVGRTRWWWWVIGGILLLAIAVVGWMALRRSGAELASLRHDKFVNDDEKRHARVDAMVLGRTSQGDAARSRADALQLEADAIEVTIEAARRKHADNLAAIARARSWHDLGAR